MERHLVAFTLLGTLGIVVVTLAVVVGCHWLFDSTASAWWTTPIAIALALALTPMASRRMPSWLDGSARRHPVKAVLFGLLAAVAIVQTARITSNRIDPSEPFLILTANEFWARHECGTAYFHACELLDRGEKNIYAAEHYPILNRDLAPETRFEGMRVEDSYQYPPQFLLLPKAILLFTDHYPTIRFVWFAMQFLGIAAVFLLLAHWVGGKAGRWMGMLTPLVTLSPPALYSYQYTQFHFLAVALAVAGMLAFEKGRNTLGGGLLAFAIVGKIFPGFLVLLLLLERRWRPVLWTLAFGIGYTIAALLVLGPDPFTAFFGYHLPRLQSFAAFAFIDIWPEVRFELISANLSPYGQVIRLGEMGVPGMTAGVASAFNNVYVLALLAAVVAASRRLSSNSRRAQIWLGILGLASLSSRAAWGDYITLPGLWLLTVLASETAGRRGLAVTAGVCLAFFYLLPGLVPLGVHPAQPVAYTLATVNFVLLIALLSWGVLRCGTAPAQQDHDSTVGRGLADGR